MATSSFSRTSRASTGAAPPVDTAITSGERSTIAGTMKLDSSTSSTTFTSTSRSRPAAATAALTARSSVAATASRTPCRCSVANGSAR